MPIVLSTNFVENVSFLTIDSKTSDLSKVVSILRETWELQVFVKLQQGKIMVPDEVVNQSLARAILGNQQIKELSITSLANHTLKINALTQDVGHVVLLCKIEQFEHDKVHSVVKIKVLDKQLPDQPLLEAIFSKVSLAMVSKLVGDIDVGTGMVISISDNDICADVHQVLYDSKFGRIQLLGVKPLDALVIRRVIPQEGYVEVVASIELPDHSIDMVKNILKSKE